MQPQLHAVYHTSISLCLIFSLSLSLSPSLCSSIYLSVCMYDLSPRPKTAKGSPSSGSMCLLFFTFSFNHLQKSRALSAQNTHPPTHTWVNTQSAASMSLSLVRLIARTRAHLLSHIDSQAAMSTAYIPNTHLWAHPRHTLPAAKQWALLLSLHRWTQQATLQNTACMLVI